jgi:hypothetical protein
MFAIGFPYRPTLLAVSTAALLAACAQTPMGPTVQVMPGPGKGFDTFQSDQAVCKGYAADQVRGQADEANKQAVGAALLTTVLGAGVGAAGGAIGGNAGGGAAVGAAAGAGLGAGIGAGNSANAQIGIQAQYDNAFSQCMYSKGDLVPGYAPIAAAPAASYSGPDPALVRGVQRELIRLNYLHDVADGSFGPRTASAIRSFEQASGMPVDGAVSGPLLARLQSTPTSQAAGGGAAPAAWVAPSTGAATANTTAIAPGSSAWVAPAQGSGGVTPAAATTTAPGAGGTWVPPATTTQ